MLAIIIGLMFIILGFWGVAVWWADILTLFKGSVPIMLLVGGASAIVIGILAIIKNNQSIEEKKENKNESK